MALSTDDIKQITAEIYNLGDDDLYKALHHVGDDMVKAEIQENLKDLLSPIHYKQVVAVFNLSTGWKEERI